MIKKLILITSVSWYIYTEYKRLNIVYKLKKELKKQKNIIDKLEFDKKILDTILKNKNKKNGSESSPKYTRRYWH